MISYLLVLVVKMYGQIVNVLAYAGDLVLLAPSWRALQRLITLLNVHAESLDLTCNTLKTVAMVFDPKNKQNCL